MVHELIFTAPVNAASVQFYYQTEIAAGPFTVSDASLAEAIPGYTITRKTYALNGRTIATRISGNQEGENGLFYIHSDHPSALLRTGLGSTSVMSYGQGHANPGTKVLGSTAHYLPFGDWRVEQAHELTDQGFTGHKHNDDLGLIYMNARYYVGSIGRFASADTIVPDRSNPQQYDRYTYVLNNPLRFTDPTGHCVERQCEAWIGRWGSQSQQESALAVDNSEFLSLSSTPSTDNSSTGADVNISSSVSIPGAALIGWGVTNQFIISQAELINLLDGGQSRWISYSGNGPITVKPAKAVEGVPKLARVFAGVSYALIGVETAYDLYQLDVMYADGMLNKQQYNLHYDPQRQLELPIDDN